MRMLDPLKESESRIPRTNQSGWDHGLESSSSRTGVDDQLIPSHDSVNVWVMSIPKQPSLYETRADSVRSPCEGWTCYLDA
jgi:hypothetical protein